MMKRSGFFVFVFVLNSLILNIQRVSGSKDISSFERKDLDRVYKLPGQSFEVNFAHYSGYVDVNKDKALFYWFFEAVENPSSKPLLLWLNGGPGCSSIAYGEAEEIGPFHIRPDGKTLYQNPYSWNQVANVLFLDSPVGRFQYKGREFYLSGESYVGNAVTDDYHDDLGIFQFMWSTGLISDQTYKLLNAYCDSESSTHPSSECNKILDVADKENGNIDAYSIYTPSCTATVRLRLGEKYDPCTEADSTIYFNLPEVQKALHVNPAVAPTKWKTCSDEVSADNWKDSPKSVLPIYKDGDTDSVIPITATRYSIDALKLPTVSPFRAWYDDGQVGGWTQGYEGLTFVSVRGAGHEVLYTDLNLHSLLSRPSWQEMPCQVYLCNTPILDHIVAFLYASQLSNIIGLMANFFCALYFFLPKVSFILINCHFQMISMNVVT
ncbi:hypothetical protein MKW92_041850 [Papaver armeniacum]|nr:hypothetical protein MKW92_041850 [Papaver armeniacum]